MLTRALVCPTLVGREEELQRLVECRLAAARGHGALVLVSGDAGIGKSRLLVAFRRTLSGGRGSVRVGLNREFGSVPYGAVLEALRPLADGGSFSAAQSRAEQLAYLVDQCIRTCARRTMVLVLEDIHWADDGTLLFLQQLLPSLEGRRLLAIATYRSDDVHRLEHLEPHLARLARSRATHAIQLAPLSAPEIRRLVRLAAQQHTIPADVVEEIVERCDGNPFFAEELLKNALENPARAYVTPLPRTIRATVLERMAGLDERSREVLSRAAVFGRRFEAGFLAEICEMDRSGVLESLRRLRTLQLIDELAGDPPSFAFRHALTQRTIYEELLEVERRPLHARILEVLEARGGDDADLGYHAWAAREAEKAIVHNERAGDRAQTLHVYGEAVRCYDRAIAFAQDRAVRGRLLEKCAAAYAADGKATQALERYAEAAQEYGHSGLSHRAADVYAAMSAQARVSGDNERGIRILERAIGVVDDGEPKARAKLQVGMAYLRLDRGDVDGGKALLAQARVLEGTPQYCSAVQYAELVGGDVAAFRSAAGKTAAAHDKLDAPERLRARFNRAFGFAILGCDDEAMADFEALFPELRQARLPALEIAALANAALIHARAGRLAQAMHAVEQAALIPEPTTTAPIGLAAAALTVAFLLWNEALVQRLCSAEIVEAAFASRINSTLGRIAGPYARWLCATGNAQAGQRILERACATLYGPFGATETLLAAIELGNERTRSAALRHLTALDAMAGTDVYAATAHHVRAFDALHSGDTAGSHLHAQAAQTYYTRMGWAVHQAQCEELLGRTKQAAARYRHLQAAGPLRFLQTHSAERIESPALSEREREIAALVARGTVNKSIAEHLCVNQRTVEKHLTSIYEKLGLRNRSELAAYMTRPPQ